MQQSGGQISGEHAEPPDGGEDRLSALPDEVVVLVLECLDTTAEAVRTSVLARRWRRLRPLLSKLRFHCRPDGNRIGELLDVPGAPELRYISVTTKGVAPDSATAWLTAAARRLTGGLVYSGMDRYMENDEEDPHLEDDEEDPHVENDEEDPHVENDEEDPHLESDEEDPHVEIDEEDPHLENDEEVNARRGGNVQLPCFEKATTIDICGDGGLFGLVLPSVGVFTRLTDLSLSFVHFRGPCELGNVVSTPRCPCLQKLSIMLARGLQDLSIHSESLL